MPADRDVVAVWQAERVHRCQSCGTFDWEWEENPDAWHADHDTCEGCRRVAIQSKRVRMSPSADDHAGIQVRLYRSKREER